MPFFFEADYDIALLFDKSKLEMISLWNNNLDLTRYPVVFLDQTKYIVFGGYLDGSLRIFKNNIQERQSIIYKHKFTVCCLQEDDSREGY
jgi:hypothetical protein